MYPISLRVVNVFQHRDVTYPFEAGITGIVGRNGSGKSNMLEAIYFGITGKTSADVVKSDMVNWQDPVGYTEFSFEHAGARYLLKRMVHSATVKLTGGVIEKALGSKDANAFMESALGFSFERFYETCWTPQGGLISIITMGHSQRVAYFQRLADVRKAEALRGVLQASIGKLPAHPDRTDQIVALDLEIQELLTNEESASQTLEQLSTMFVAYESQYPATQKILATQTLEQYTRFVGVAQQDQLQAQDAVIKFSELNDIPLVPEVHPPDPALEEARRKSAARNDLRAKVEYSSQMLDRARKTIPVQPEDPAEIRVQYDTLRGVVIGNKAKYDMAAQGVCPTCTRPFEFEGGDAARKVVVDAHMENTHKLGALHTELTQKVHAFTHHQQIVAQIEGSNKTHQIIIDDSTKQLEEIGDVLFDEVEYQRQQAAWRDYSAYLAKVAQHQKHMDELNQAVQVCMGKVQTAQAQEYTSDEARVTAEEFMRNYKDIAHKRTESSSYIAGVVARRSALESQLEGFKKEQEQRLTVQVVRERLSRAREILHRDNLPKLVMQKILIGLNAQLDSYLALFDTNFTAYIDEEFDFIASFALKSGVPARSLSGGQKVALALAFKFAVSDLMATQVPVMILDEPTVWLDDINKPRLAEVMQKAKAATEKGRVCVAVATHEELLFPAFSRTFDIGENSDY